jgi:type II secretory ATPase GspE/PulE/Tfp pilus assembly ATPase PilB-like protein
MNGQRDTRALHLELSTLSPEDAVHRLIEHVAELGGSDLYLNTNEDHVTASARLMGILRRIAVLPLDMGRRCLSHLKAVANMNVAERRRPLDSRLIYELPQKGPIDLRINTIPTLYGEDMSLRLLAREMRQLAIDQLGLLRQDHNQLLSLLGNPSGLILVTGPTGSGKTTTLYACLSHLNNGDRKINTIEDPVEYAVEGIRQSQINPRIDVGFAELLRSVLRQAPDVIMVGEIRDAVTAETAVRAANSGHLVLTTLHAPVAAGAIQSMLALGVHPHFLASCLLGAVAQRLVRTLCPKCKIAYDISDSPHTFEEVRPWLEEGQGHTIFGPRGCEACFFQAYSGRIGVFELLAVNRAMRKMIISRSPTHQIQQKAIEDGMVEFRRGALLHVARGVTSIEEVFRSLPSEYLILED